MEIVLYIIACLLQPICWPFPEMSTIYFGTLILSPTMAFIIGYVCILLGIAFMYKISFHLSEKYLKKLKRKKSFKKYQKYIKENEILTTGALFILPILPDEIICVGSAIIGIKFKVVMYIAIFSKAISIGLVAYSSTLSNIFSIPQYIIILIELLVILIFSITYKRYKEK